MGVRITIIGSSDRRLEELVRASGLRPTIAAATDLLALTHPGAAQPDVLIMDLGSHSEVPAALAVLKRQHPTTSVILVVPELTPALMLEAMRSGVSECVAQPLTEENVGSAISRVIAQRALPVGGQVFAFIGAKGGVGTTTLAVNVATALARVEGSTLFADMHPAYGDAAVLFGAEPRFSFLDALENTHRLDLSYFNGLATQTKAGVSLLASPDDAPTTPIDLHRVRLLLDFAIRNYRYTVLDVPRSTPAMLEALESAVGIFVVTNQELASVRGASRVANALSRRYTREKVSVVVSRFDKGADITSDDIEEVVHAPVRFTFPSEHRVALQALNDGAPFVLGGESKLAAAVTAFTRSIAGDVHVGPGAPPSAGSKPFLNRFSALRWMTS